LPLKNAQNHLSPLKALIPCLALFVASTHAAESWPQFRGPNGAGIAADAARPPTVFGPDKNVRWQAVVPRGVSSPIVAGDRVFVTGVADGAIVTLAFDAQDGRELWRKALPAQSLEKVHGFSSPAAATPCTDGQRVFVYANSFGVVAYDFAGKELWQRPLPVQNIEYGAGNSPVVAGGSVIVLRDGTSADSHLIALDPATGATAWDSPRPFARNSHATPMVWRHDGIEELVVKGRGRVAGYNPANGEMRWWVNGWGNAAIATAVAADGLLFVGSKGTGDPSEPPPPDLNWDKLVAAHDADRDGSLALEEVPKELLFHIRKEIPSTTPGNSMGIRNLLQKYIDGNKDGKVTKEEWDIAMTGFNSPQNRDRFVAIRPGGQGDVSATHIAWETTKGLNEMASPLVYRGRVYVVADGGRVSAFQPATGERLLDRQPLGAPGQYVGSPVAANGLVYFVSEAGTVTILRAGDAFEIVARIELKESVRSTPAIVGRSLYVRAMERLWAFAE
jgi:outer membrane protein assembly factor BamB